MLINSTEIISLSDKWTLYLAAIGLVGTSIGLFFTYKEFQKNNKTKRAEFLEKLTEEFNDQKMFLAKKILDDFWVFTQGLDIQSDKELLAEGSNQENPEEKIQFELTYILRDHKVSPVTLNGEQRIRQAFDDLLDFFTKLDYYIKLQLIYIEELNYFKYYIEKCAGKNNAILKYAVIYDFPALFRLLSVLEISIENVELKQHQQNVINAGDIKYRY